MPLFVCLGSQRYRVERPWGDLGGDLGAGVGRVSDVACDTNGHLHVLFRRDSQVDPSCPSVVVLEPNGTRQSAWGAEIVDGHMLACGPNSSVWVVDRDAHEVIVFDRTGRRQGSLGQRDQPGAPFNHPTDLAFAANGDVFVADGYGASCVHRFRGPTRIGGWGEPGEADGQFSTPHAVCVMADGRIAVADRENHRVQIFAADGSHLATWRDHHKPMALATDNAGNLLVTDQVPRLSLLSPDGVLLGRCRPVLNGAHGVACGPDGCIYLAEINPSRITRMVPC